MSNQTRSVSFPARPRHPIILIIEHDLNKLRWWQHDHSISSSSTMAESVFFSLSRLEELHDCMVEILRLPSIRQALANLQQASFFVDSLLDASLKLLDVRTSSRDAVLVIKEHAQDLQTAMRRRRRRIAGGADSSAALEMIVPNYTRFRKRMKKDAKRNITLLKQIEQDLEGSGSLPQDPHHQPLISSIIRAVKDVILASASSFESLLMFVSAELESKTKQVVASKWSTLASRFMTKQATSDDSKYIASNEFGTLDAELGGVGKGMMRSSISNEIQSVEMIVDGMESRLERVFRCLVKTRASFLNIRSHQQL